jgi:hypothetical protein
MKILAIGNSFSQDATRYLYGIARADGQPMKVVNLYIGGCPLERHYRNMLSNEPAYSMELNGVSSGFMVSLDEALYSDRFDVITLQQLSQEAPYYKTYQPYLDALVAHVRRAQPAAKLYMHQTWAYEAGSYRLCEELKFSQPEEMLSLVRAAYNTAAAAIGADGVIPAGETMLNLSHLGIKKPHRDSFHASLGVGRYALALTWYGKLTGREFSENRFRDFDVPVSEDEVAIAKEAARRALRGEAV